MASRALSPAERRIVANHQANVRDVAACFKEAIERDKTRAPQGMREDAFSGMWHFSKIRARLPEEVRDLEQYIFEFAPSPREPELNLRLMRICLAMYFLDKMGEFSEAVRKSGGTQLTSLFTVARMRVEKLLDDGYFSKTSKQILGDYLDAQCALASLSAATSVPIHEPYDAVKMYHKKACDLIREAESSRQPIPG